MEECESLDTEMTELQEFQCESLDAVDQDDEDEEEELRNSLREVVQDPTVKPKLQCLMVDPSFSMVTVQSEDSGIVWETASSRCSTPWASEASSPSEVYSNEGSGAQGKITIVFDEEKVVRRRTRSGGRSRLGDRLRRPGSSRSASVLGVERPEMAEVSIPNIKTDTTEVDPDLEVLKDKDQQLFSLISEGYEILNIRVPSKLPTVDEEESTELQDNLSYLDETPAIKSQQSRAASQCRTQAAHAFPGIVEVEAFEQENEEETNTVPQEASPDAEATGMRNRKDGTSDMDYFEHFTLVDEVIASPAEEVEELGQSKGEKPAPQPQAEEESSGQAAASDSPSAPDDSFEFITDVEIAGEHLDEVFYGGGLHETAEAEAPPEEGEKRPRRRRESGRSQKGSGSALFSVEETTLTPIFLSPGPPKIIDPILLEEPTAMSFLYADLYEDAMGERRRSDEDCSEAGSVVSESSCVRRLSESGDGEETPGYLEKFILKDETPVAESQAHTEDSKEGGTMMWTQSKFEMTGCLVRVEEEEEQETEEEKKIEEAGAGAAGGDKQPTEEAGPIKAGPAGLGEDPKPREEEIGGELEEVMREALENSESVPIDVAPIALAEQINTAQQGKEQLEAEPTEIVDPSVMEQTESAAAVIVSDAEVSRLQNVTSGTDTQAKSETQATKGQEEASSDKVAVGTIEEPLTELKEPGSVEVVPQGVSSPKVPVELAEALAPATKEEVTDDRTEAEVKDSEEKAGVDAKMDAVVQCSEKAQEIIVSAIEVHPEAMEPDTPVKEAEASVITDVLEEARENREVADVAPAVAVTPSEVVTVSEPAAKADVAAEQEGAGKSQAAILDAAEQASDVPVGEVKPEPVPEAVKMEQAEIIAEPQKPAIGEERIDTEAKVEKTADICSEGSARDTVSPIVDTGVDVGTQEEVTAIYDQDEVTCNVDTTGDKALSEVIEKAAEKTEFLEIPAQSISRELTTAEKPEATVGITEQERNQEETVTGEEQKTEMVVPPDIVVEKQELTAAEEPSADKDMSGAAPLNQPEINTEVTYKEEETVVVERATAGEVDTLPEPSSQAGDIPPEMALEGLELLTVVLKGVKPLEVVDTSSEVQETVKEEEELLSLAPESETVEIQTQAGVGQKKEEVQESVKEEEELLSPAPEGETVEIQTQAGVGQKKEEVQESVKEEEELLSLAPESETVEIQTQAGVGQKKEEVQETVKEEEELLSLAPESETVEIQTQAGVGQKKEEVQETVKEEEGLLSLAPESETVEIQTKAGVGQKKEEVQESVRVDKELLPLAPQGQTAEIPMQAGAGQETEEVPEETVAVALADALAPLPLASTEVEREERETAPAEEVPPIEASEWWPSPPASLDVEEAREQMEEPEEEDLEEFPGCLSTLRSFPPQEDLSALHREEGEEVANVYEDTAEELGYEMISAQELSESPGEEGGKEGGEPRPPGPDSSLGRGEKEEAAAMEEDALEPSQDEEAVEAGYEIIDAEEESQARAAEELQGMDWFCLTCDSLLSEGDRGEHRHHDVTAVDGAYEDVKEQLSEWISELQQRSENIEDLVSELELAYNSVEDQCRGSEEAMQDQNEEVMALLMEQYTSMSLGMEEEKKAKLEQLYDQIVSFQESIDTAKGTLETTAREAETDARSPAEIQTRLNTALESAMTLELGPKGLLVFEDYAKGNTSNTHRKGIPVPQKPSLQPQEKGSATSTSVTVYWNVNPGDIIDCFQVYCMEDPQGAVSEEYRVTVKESYCVLEELDPDKTYKVWVMAVNYTGCSLPSERQSFRTAPLVPVIDTESCSVLWDSATLRWSSASHTAAQSYTLEYCRQYALEGEGLRSISGIRGTEQRVILQPNENYLFYIKAVNEAGASEQSEAALISTKGTRFHLLKASAHPALDLSEDRSTVHYSQEAYDQTQDTDNLYPSIVGEVLPARGRHYWETKVARSTAYRVGVALGTANRNSPLGENSSSWCLHCVPTTSSCRFELLNASVQSDVFVVEVPERVGVLLDYKQGSLSFYNAKSGQRLGTLCHHFTQPCHPALGIEDPGSLEVSMVLEVPEFAKHS